MSFKNSAGAAAGGAFARAFADRAASKLWPDADQLSLEDASVRVQRQRQAARDLRKWRWPVRMLSVIAGLGTAHGIAISGRKRT